ncbi:MAG: phage tail tape measure protein [Candidatus Methanomethylophilaceae archaeon]|nr:phage tail tape measure protein [Candidatus Methanomethylophilaceae archaeon]
MASTISITYKLQGNLKDLKALTSDADGLKKAFAGAAVEAEQLPKKMGGLRSFSGSLTKSLGGLAASVVSVGALVKGLSSAVNTMKEFEKANSELASVLGKSVKEINGLTESAMELGKRTSFTAAEVTSLQTSLARLGFTEGQITAMQESVLKFAAAVGTDLASAADFSGAALRSFGLKASDSQALLDLMAASCSKSALSFSKLQTSISVVGPVANSFGLSARDTVAILGVLSNAGFDASSAATALRNILLNLANANGKLVGGLGHTATTMPEIIDALQELKDSGVELNEMLEMTDKRSVAAFSALVAGAGDVRELYDALGDCNGALDEMYNTMSDNLEGAIKRVGSAWQDLVLQFRNSTGILKTVFDRFARGLNVWSNMEKGMNRHDAKIAALGDAYIGTGQLKTLDDYDKAIDRINAKEKKSAQDRKTLEVLQYARMKIFREQMNASISAFGEGADALGDLAGAETAEGNAAEGSKSKKKGLAEAIQDYNASVERAVQLNQELGYKQTDEIARLDAMKSGLTSLINKYGTEDAAVKQLIVDYKELLTARRGAGAVALDISGVAAVSGPGASIQGKTAKKKGLAPGLVGTDLKKFNKETGKAMTQTEALQTTVGALAGVFHDLAGAVGESAAAWLEWGSNLLSAIAQALPQLTALFVKQNAAATANTAAAATGGASAVASIPYVGPVLAVAAVASILAALASLPKFAAGGVISGPTMGLMGEYHGAVNNPEVVAPLNTLRQYIQPSGLGGEVDFRIRGRDLYGTLKKDRRRSSRS